jgi:hypothetical protein
VSELSEQERVVRNLCSEVYTAEGVEIWMNAPNRSLNNATPLQFIAAGDTDRVLQVLEQLITGGFA